MPQRLPGRREGGVCALTHGHSDGASPPERQFTPELLNSGVHGFLPSEETTHKLGETCALAQICARWCLRYPRVLTSSVRRAAMCRCPLPAELRGVWVYVFRGLSREQGRAVDAVRM